MAYTAHVPGHTGGPEPELIIRDDRGTPAVQRTLAAPVDQPEDAEGILRDQGWETTAAWTMTDQGWTAPVQPINTETS
ncbi:MAG: hypothetical protein ACRDMV_16105 [Streptosporangiales bacterium]